jgi:glycosyltransferase involved in cell wall biosynthesis
MKMDLSAEPLFINGRFLTQPLSGVQRFASEITAALQRIHRGRVTILAPPGVPVSSPAIRPIGRYCGHVWEQFELPRHAVEGVLLNLGNTAPLISRRQVAVIHDAGVFSTPEAYSWRFRAWYKLLQKGLVHSQAKIVTVSDFSRTELVRHLGACPDRLAVIGEGADHMQSIVADPRILSATGLTPGRFVLAVGNLAVHKNLAALGVLARALVQREMTLAITGGLQVGAFRHDTALPAPARYLGRVSDNDLKTLYQSAACFVFPSRYEGFGLPAIEAMACRCLVVAADIPALRETCGPAAIYCAPDSPTDIANQVCRLLDDPDAAHALRQAAAAHVARHTWDRAASALDRVIAAMSLVNASPGGRGPDQMS